VSPLPIGPTTLAPARRLFGFAESIPAQAWSVEGPRSDYLLVTFGEPEHNLAVIDPGDGTDRSSATMPGTQRHPTVDRDAAVRASRMGHPVVARLVWRPCRATRSPLYPLWEISNGTRRVFVNQARRVYSEEQL